MAIKITLSKVWYQEENRRILATVMYSEQQPDETWNTVQTEVFLPWIDSYEELKRAATEKAKDFLSHIASSV